MDVVDIKTDPDIPSVKPAQQGPMPLPMTNPGAAVETGAPAGATSLAPNLNAFLGGKKGLVQSSMMAPGQHPSASPMVQVPMSPEHPMITNSNGAPPAPPNLSGGVAPAVQVKLPANGAQSNDIYGTW